MGISLNFAPLIVETVHAAARQRRLMTLGRQTLDFGVTETRILAEQARVGMRATATTDRNLTQEEFFNSLGWDAIHSLDVSGFEGATHLFDLNASPETLPASLRGSYDAVYDGGTLEHVFNIFNGLSNALSLLKADGRFVHIGPMNNYVDHGFFQFSPTFFFDFASANGWRVVKSALVKVIYDGHAPGICEISHLPPGRFGTVGQLDNGSYLHFLVMDRDPASTVDIVPKQSLYVRAHGDGLLATLDTEAFPAYKVDRGRVVLL